VRLTGRRLSRGPQGHRLQARVRPPQAAATRARLSRRPVQPDVCRRLNAAHQARL
jgi:hypothetical protein